MLFRSYSHPSAHTVSEVTGLQGLLDGKTTETYVTTQVAALVASSPATLDTLNELAAALGNDPSFATTTANSIGTKLPLAGGTMTGDVSLGDNVKATFGAGNDLQIFHDSGNSVIQDNGVGDLYIMGESSIRLTNNNAVNHYAKFNNGGSVQLYHNNLQKLATTSTGVDVTGDVNLGDNDDITWGTNPGRTLIRGNESTDTILIKTDNAERLRITSAGNVGIGTTGPDVKLALHETAAIIASGVADRTSTMKGIKITTPQNGNESLGLWFGTGGNHWSGVSGQRNNSSASWGTDLRFYTHSNSTSALTTSTERMRISSEGIVTTPNQPNCSVNNSPGYAIGDLTGGTVAYDITGMYTSANGRFTAPVSGIYMVGATFYTISSSTMEIFVKVNGSNRAYLNNVTSARASFGYGVGTTVKVNANDYIQFYNNKGQIRGSANEYRYVYLIN